MDQTREYAIILIGLDARITAWLGAAPLVFGYTSDEAVGQPCGLLFTPEDRAKGFDTHELEIAKSTGGVEDDRWHVRKDGTRIWVTGSVQAITDEEGGFLGFVKVARDRTDLQARIERQEQQVAGQQAASRRTHAFLRTLGHEMRNPLTPLTNAAHIIRKVSTDKHLDRVAEIIDAQVSTLQRMADDLMDVARLDVGKVRLQCQRTDLRQVLDEACTTFRAAANAKGVTLVGLLPRGALVADVDLARFRQVIHNLLTNAIRYTPAGGAIWLKATQEEDEVVIKVEDNGVGISSEMLPKLFDLFTRDPSAAELEPSGLGVGLAVVKAVMELHGGSVQARSSGPGKGAEFAVRLPAAGSPGMQNGSPP
jgi:PAS domain S-box-containing protein